LGETLNYLLTQLAFRYRELKYILQAIRSPRVLQGIKAIYYLTKNAPIARLANLVSSILEYGNEG
jgi:hypothetical protein